MKVETLSNRIFREFVSVSTRTAMAIPKQSTHLVAPILFACLCVSAGAQSNEWARMSGSSTGDSVGVYGTLGTPAPENAPGGRYQPVTWTDNKGNLWLFGGQGVDGAANIGFLNDFWKFDPITNQWTWMGGSSDAGPGIGEGVGVYGTLGTPAAGNIPPGRAGAVGWTDAKGNLWLFGGGSDSSSGGSVFDDLWEFNPSTNEWAWMS